MDGTTIFAIILFILIIASYIWLIIISVKLDKKEDKEPEKTEESEETFINY